MCTKRIESIFVMNVHCYNTEPASTEVHCIPLDLLIDRKPCT